MLQRLKLLFTIIAVLSVIGLNAIGQDTTTPSDDSPAPKKSALDPSVGVAPGGMQQHVPGRWAMLSVAGINPTDQDFEETVAVIVDNNTNLQYARRVWFPAGSRRQAWLPIRIPADIPYDQRMIDMTSLRIRDASKGTEQFQTDSIGMPSTTRSLLVSDEESRVALLLEQADPSDDIASERVYHIANTVNAGRDAASSSNGGMGPIYINDYLLPSSPVGLDVIDQIVIASDRVLDDTMSLSRLQSWVQDGGQIWLMADQVSPDAARKLLGDIMCYTVVDRVELNRFKLSAGDGAVNSFDRRVDEWVSDTPVEFLRVIAETDDVVCSIDGWPAAFRKRIGNGEVLFTTLGARGLVDGARPLPVFESVSRRFFARRSLTPQPTEQLQSFVDDEIGYAIPGRSVIALLLGLHLTTVVVSGIWLSRRKNLHYLAAVIPIASIVAAGTFVMMGKAKTGAVPSTIALSQIVRNLPSTSEVSIHSIAAVYSQDSRPFEIVSSADTTSMLNDGLEDGEVKRIQWDDSGKSEWIFVNQPPGVVRHVETHTTTELSPGWSVKGKFTKNGFEGRVQGLNAIGADDGVIIAAPAPSLAVEFATGSAQQFTSDREDVLAPDQFIRSAIVSDVQRDRQELLRQMLGRETPPFGREPILLVWTDPVDAGVRFDDGFDRRGSALVSLPIQMEPTASGDEFKVPATFVRIEPYAGTRGLTAIFNSRTGQWIEMNQPSEAELQCVIPNSLTPCRLSRAEVTIKMSAPSRTLDVRCLIDGEFQSVFTKQDPSGVLRFTIDDPNALTLNDQGGVVLSIAISQSEEERLQAEQEKAIAENATAVGDGPITAKISEPSRSIWKIDFIQVDVEGTKL